MNERVLYPSTGIKDVSLLQQEEQTSKAVGAHDQAEAANDCRQLTYFELARLMERVSRRFSGLVRAELTKLRVDDIGPAQAMVLLAIGDAELSVAELLDRGHYVGSNVSYYLKQLADGDYIDRVASQRDKRSARIKLTEKGRLLRANLRDAAMAYERALNRGHQDRQNLETAFQTLHQLELVWGSASRYDM
ncbi:MULTISPECIES: MarR family transcriptional regulator [Ensifer]|uniref:MarR family transcriptional regulator n=1 Tax=Ensifer canadensis TaxID=555315 RepID=A0AAW4FV00_9HYPH|nr:MULTISPECIES: MarR family transcriptional regulator [Ensifer]KQW49587.1 MarR family transcriptional regulator [Ensifer sp. Root1252]KQW66567.1 MarR family transcriptional regulator [Ensifer sp. Root127]KQY68030.1 MarR family transcriptional regulator [Ensifer sp. Root142]KRC72829.1 MarR family transcriptional regulator [Ensifer sp. Root231]KRC94177.1 MarR family transcriptional regulator [Ensifer sp. Root258]